MKPGIDYIRKKYYERKYYERKVCPSCRSPMMEIDDDFEYQGKLKDVNIGHFLKRDIKPLNLWLYGKLVGYECTSNHKWADKIIVKKAIINCPNPKCDGKLLAKKSPYLYCQYFGKGCYINGIRVDDSRTRKAFKRFLDGLLHYLQTTFSEYDFEYFTHIKKGYEWWKELKITEKRVVKEKDLKEKIRKELRDLKRELL